MNTYDENLSSTVVASLQAMGLEEKKIKSELNASLFNLYYAEGATITAEEKLDASKKELTEKSRVKTQAVDCNNVSVNLLSSATQGDQYVKQSITNTAVCAANIQVAANAIVRLAGDIGSAYSIVNAADRNTDIYKQTLEVVELINKTAYDAEVASQLAMESSMLTSEISSSTVLDKAKAENALMGNMLKVAGAEFDEHSQIVASDSATLSQASATEKVAEGNLEDISVDYTATTAAYKTMNKYLNINLTAKPDRAHTNSTFVVRFNMIKSAYETNKSEVHYPVEQYYLIVVKERNKGVFSLTNADSALHQNTNQCIPVQTEDISGNAVKRSINIYDTTIFPDGNPLLDSDGDKIELGENYVVFVMAIYYDDYKRKINNFDDFLSAPSQAFSLTNELARVDGSKIGFHPFVLDSLSPDQKAAYDKYHANGGVVPEYYFQFEVTENPEFAVEYRSMLLLANQNNLKGMLTENSLKALGHEISSLQKIAEHFDPKIAALESERNNLISKMESLDATSSEAIETNEEIEEVIEKIQKLTEQRDHEMKEKSASGKRSKIDFMFNLTIAEQISAGNYYTAVPVEESDEKGSASRAKSAGKKGGEDEDAVVRKPVEWLAFVGADATDNFGNKLAENFAYVPAVLSFSTANESNLDQFTNALSSIDGAKVYTYHSK